MKPDTFVEVAAAVAAVAAIVAAFYARASVRAAGHAVDAAQRLCQIAEVTRRSSERARLRFRVERVGELVEDIFFTASLAELGAGELSPRTRGQCRVLDQAVIGLKEILPKSGEVSQATSPGELTDRADIARTEVDRVLKGLTRKRTGYRRRRTFRSRRPVPWHRSTGPLVNPGG